MPGPRQPVQLIGIHSFTQTLPLGFVNEVKLYVVGKIHSRKCSKIFLVKFLTVIVYGKISLL